MAGLKIWDSVSEREGTFFLRAIFSNPALEPTSYALDIGNSFTGATVFGARSCPFTSVQYRCSVRATSNVKLGLSQWRDI